MKFEKFVELCEKSIKLDPWVKERDIKGYAIELINEANEVKIEADNEDYEKLKDELGDVLNDWLHMVLLAEKQGHFTRTDLINHALEKYNRRKPYLKDGKIVSKDEARLLWKEAKQKEKQMTK